MKPYSVEKMKIQKDFLCALIVALTFSLPTMAQTNASGSSDWYSTRGTKVYQNEAQKLTKSEVRAMLANTEFLDPYNQGIKYNQAANKWLIASCGLVVASCTWWVVAADAVYHEEHYEFRYGGLSTPDFIGVIGTATLACGAFVMWVVKKTQAITLIGPAVDGYNTSRHTSGAALNFGFTGNGVALVLKF